MAQTRSTMPPLARPLADAYEPLVIVLPAACAGVASDRWLGGGTAWWWLAAAALALWCWLWKSKRERAASGALLLAVLALFAAWNHVCWHLIDTDELARFADEEPQPAAIEVVALTGPRRSRAPPADPLRAIPQVDHTRLEVAIAGIRNADRWQPAAGKALLLVDGHLLDVQAGDRLRLFGQLARPRGPANPGEFDFAAFARGQGRLSLIRCDFPNCVEVRERGSSFSPRRILAAMRSEGDSLLWRSLRFERSGLAAALLLGAREELDDQRSEAFLQTGTVHVFIFTRYCKT